MVGNGIVVDISSIRNQERYGSICNGFGISRDYLGDRHFMAAMEYAPGYSGGIDFRGIGADEKEADEKTGFFCPLDEFQLVRC